MCASNELKQNLNLVSEAIKNYPKFLEFDITQTNLKPDFILKNKKYNTFSIESLVKRPEFVKKMEEIFSDREILIKAVSQVSSVLK